MNEQPILLESRSRRRSNPCEAEEVLHESGSATDKLLEGALFFDTDNAVALTGCEGEILRLIVSGQTNKQIAKHLSRSERTVEFHRHRLMRKMAAHNAAELVRRAIVMGVI